MAVSAAGVARDETPYCCIPCAVSTTVRFWFSSPSDGSSLSLWLSSIPAAFPVTTMTSLAARTSRSEFACISLDMMIFPSALIHTQEFSLARTLTTKPSTTDPELPEVAGGFSAGDFSADGDATAGTMTCGCAPVVEGAWFWFAEALSGAGTAGAESARKGFAVAGGVASRLNLAQPC